ncbi:TonB-dependent receptor [Hymenobacter sp. BT770]|uniref:SusC/RagA family TonB-linked outer membrane protein n=1 Tax=Hymenobacter sp. BT770 TaxID=2886942 RepID=UPI001D0F4D9B|nr:TonB-dependent receptor [Hymenobacter sp. BT770]MCC3152695.1 TonB-dependent receptor [Hymenobacter sp. BT770]MDO3414768.1 TonB-dependent receptor [Hymenobacter sp. BT770]
MVLAFVAHDLQAQSRTVSGAVVGSDGASIPGVTVIVKGGNQGTSTDSDGKYSLSVPEGATTLVYSFVGYDNKEVAIGNQSTINVTLKVNPTGLDEVVVVGYGTQSRRDLTGNVATVSGKQIATAPVQSFDQALQGRASGVNITTPNGLLNNPPVIRIRGVNSINLSSAPLIVIDGIPAFSGNSSAVGSVPNNPLSNLNPADIESMEVLKDASATAIYGSRAAGGVILVTTKKGKKGQSHVSYDTYVGWTKPVRLYDVMGAQDYVNVKNEAVRNLNANQKSVGGAGANVEGFKLTDANGNSADTRWYDYIYRTGFSQAHNLNFSGGTDKTNFYSSVGYTNQKGMLVRNDFKRVSARLNVDHKVFNNFTVGMRVGYSNTQNSSPNSGSASGAGGAFGTAGLGRLPLVLPPNIAPFNPDGSYNTSGAGIGPGPNINPTSSTGAPLLPGYYNPLVDLENNYFNSEGSEIQGSVYADWEILKGLNLRTSYGINNISFEDKAFYTAIAGDGFSGGGEADNYYRTNKRWNWQNTAQYDHSFGEKHNFSFLLGNEQQYTDILRWGASRTAVADPFFTSYQGNFTNISAAGNFQGANYLVSFFGRMNYNYDHKYLATVNVRRDGYSAWAKKYGNFYGASLGYVVSEEDFWKNSSFAPAFSFLKITGSIGNVGNNQGIADYAALQTYSSGLYGSNATLYFSGAGNPSLTWETSKKTDLGLSFGFFQDRLRGDFAYYQNLVDGLILDVPQAPSKGIPGNTILGNVGSMRNTGIELNLTYNAIQAKDFTWTVSGNVTTLKNRVLGLATEGQRIGTATSLETANYTQVGHSVGEILAVPSLGVNPANGRRMIQKADGTVVQYEHLGSGWTTMDGKPATAPNQLVDGIYYGPTLPTYYGGFDNTFRYKAFDLGLFVQFSGGNYIYNGTKSGLHDQRFWNNDKDILDHWTESNHNAKWPRVVFGDNVSNGSTIVMSSNVEKGDFARLRQVSLGYSFSQSLLTRLNVASARIYVQAQNAALLTKYSGIDPEISTNGSSNTGAGVDRNSVGQARTYTVGFNIGF